MRTYQKSEGGRLWVRPAVASVMASALALAAALLDTELPLPFEISISKETLVNLLSMVATSMLTVATFSVAAIVTATTALSQSTTPRVTGLILSDATVKNVLASFISVFVFALVAIFAVEALGYGPTGRVTIFAGLVAMIVWVLISFLRWVGHVTQLGRVGTAMRRTAEAALESVRPETVGTFGAMSLGADEPTGGIPVKAERIGYVQSIDVEALQDFAEAHSGTIYVTVRPGYLVDTVEPIAHVTLPGDLRDDERPDLSAVRSAIVLDEERTHENDPRFGLVILAETASRALSPGINDPGTAIAVLTEQLAVLKRWTEVVAEEEKKEIVYTRVAIPRLHARDLSDDAFTTFVRDGAGVIEVGLRLQKTLQTLSGLGNPELSREAGRISQLAVELAETAPLAISQMIRLKEEASKAQALAAASGVE